MQHELFDPSYSNDHQGPNCKESREDTFKNVEVRDVCTYCKSASIQYILVCVVLDVGMHVMYMKKVFCTKQMLILISCLYLQILV